jgi:hypothetical protein
VKNEKNAKNKGLLFWGKKHETCTKRGQKTQKGENADTKTLEKGSVLVKMP